MCREDTKFPDRFYSYLNSNTLFWIKGGTERESFLNICMVGVDGQVFARSWNKSPRSWFTELIKSGVGQIKYYDNIINIEVKKLEKTDETQTLMNKAYLKKI